MPAILQLALGFCGFAPGRGCGRAGRTRGGGLGRSRHPPDQERGAGCGAGVKKALSRQNYRGRHEDHGRGPHRGGVRGQGRGGDHRRPGDGHRRHHRGVHPGREELRRQDCGGPDRGGRSGGPGPAGGGPGGRLHLGARGHRRADAGPGPLCHFARSEPGGARARGGGRGHQLRDRGRGRGPRGRLRHRGGRHHQGHGPGGGDPGDSPGLG